MAGSPEPRASSDHVEVEWQFDALDLRPVERWLDTHLPSTGASEPSTLGLIHGEGRTRVLTDVYLDTEDWRIFRAGFAFRVRRHGKAAETTLKSIAQRGAGPTRRVEVTEPIDLTAPIAGPDEGPIGYRIQAVAGTHPVLERIRIGTRRTIIPLLRDGAEVAELCLDRSLIPIGPGQEPVRLRRVEIEIHSPEATDRIEALVEALRTSCGMRLSGGSKFEVAMLAMGIDPTWVAETGPTEASLASSLGELAFASLRRRFRDLLAHEPGARLGEDPEELHDMRVATRRLRAALTLFGEALPVRAARFRAELGWVAGLLGDVRDLDVQLAELDRLEPKEREDLVPVIAILTERRAVARAVMLAGLDSQRYERLIRSFVDFLRHGPLRRSPLSRAPATALAPDLAGDRYRKIRRSGDRLRASSSTESFHRARIRTKKLRYALEFVEDLYGPEAREMIRSLTRLQDVLGAHQDAVVAVTRLRDLVDQAGRDLPPRTLFAMGALAERYERRARSLRRRFPKVYRELDSKSWRRLEREMARRRPSAWIPPRPHQRAAVLTPQPPSEPEAPPSTST